MEEKKLQKLCRIALMKILGPVVKRRLKKDGVMESSMADIMKVLRTAYGSADIDDIAIMEAPINIAFAWNSGQTIEEYAETHFAAYEQIAAFDEGIHSMQDTQKIIESARDCVRAASTGDKCKLPHRSALDDGSPSKTGSSISSSM